MLNWEAVGAIGQLLVSVVCMVRRISPSIETEERQQFGRGAVTQTVTRTYSDELIETLIASALF